MTIKYLDHVPNFYFSKLLLAALAIREKKPSLCVQYSEILQHISNEIQSTLH